MFQFEKARKDQGFKLNGWIVWGPTVCKYREKYYMFTTAWKQEVGFHGWEEHATILKAVSDTLEGPYTFERELTELKSQKWAGETLYCPMMKQENEKLYLFYVGSRYAQNERTRELPNDKEVYRYNQQIGVAEITDVANGTFEPFAGNPILSPQPGCWDDTYVTNPTVCCYQGTYYMIYKALIKDRLPEIVMNLGVAKANQITGPYERMENQQLSGCNVEDPFIWASDTGFHMIAKDMTGETTGEKNTTLYAKTDDITKWNLKNSVQAYTTQVEWTDGKEQYYNLERPEIYFENGRPVCLFNAVRDYQDNCFNLARNIISMD